jgi:hypothetical protein
MFISLTATATRLLTLLRMRTASFTSLTLARILLVKPFKFPNQTTPAVSLLLLVVYRRLLQGWFSIVLKLDSEAEANECQAF